MTENHVDSTPSFVQCPICGLSYKNYAQHYNLNHGQRYSKPRVKLPLGFATKNHLVYCACGDVFTGGTPIPPSIDRHWNRFRYITDSSGAVSFIQECSHPHRFGQDAEPWTLPAGDTPRSLLPLRRSITQLPAGFVYSRPRNHTKTYLSISNTKCERETSSSIRAQSTQTSTSTLGYDNYENGANILDLLTNKVHQENTNSSLDNNNELFNGTDEAQDPCVSSLPILAAQNSSIAPMYQDTISNASFIYQSLASHATAKENQPTNDFQMIQHWISQAQASLYQSGNIPHRPEGSFTEINEYYDHKYISELSREAAFQRNSAMLNESDMVHATNITSRPLGHTVSTSSCSLMRPSEVAYGRREAFNSTENMANNLKNVECLPISMPVQIKKASNLYNESFPMCEDISPLGSMVNFTTNNIPESSCEISSIPDDDFQAVLSLHLLAMQKDNF